MYLRTRARVAALMTMTTLALSLPLLLRAQDKPRFAGPTERGFLLPNGWTVSPAGEQVELTDLPLNIIPLADGRHALVATSGYNAHELIAGRPRRAEGGRLGDRPPELVRPGPRRAKREASGGRAAAATCSTRFELKGLDLTRVGEPEPRSRAGEGERAGKDEEGPHRRARREGPTSRAA